MSEKPLVPPILSVVIPVYNGRDFIVETLRSLTVQTRRDFEIIVIDDGSTDGSAAVAAEFAAAFGASEPAIRIFRQDNAGVSAARNRGIAEAQGELIGFLDADDLWAPEKVALHIVLMQQRPELDLTFSGFDFIDGGGNELYDGLAPAEGVISFEKLIVRNLIHTGTVVARRDVLIRAGGFDTSLTTFEDFDLWLKIAALRPGNIYGMARSLACYRRHGNQATGSWRNMNRGWLRVAERVAREHPEVWRKAGLDAWICHTEYCGSLAYNSGDLIEMRRLMVSVWVTGKLRVFRHKNALFMTGVFLVSYLPRAVQIVIGGAFRKLQMAIFAFRPAEKSREELPR